MKATDENGKLVPIPKCFITITGIVLPYTPSTITITMNNVPDVGDGKQASYADSPVIGRSSPIKTYSHSDNRTISWTVHLISTSRLELVRNLSYLRVFESVTYPRNGIGGAPYRPPSLCQIQFGSLLSDEPLCAIMRRYNVKFPPDVPYDHEGDQYTPYKMDVDLEFEVVYDSADLPGAEHIISLGG